MWRSKVIGALLVLLLAVLIGCENKRKVPYEAPEDEAGSEMTVRRDTNMGVNTDVISAPIDTANPAMLTFLDTHFNMGTMIEGELKEFKYRFVNTGASPLVIKNAYSGCGCTVPSYDKRPIAPGDSGVIDVVFNSKNKRGKVFKRVVVLANTYPEDANVVTLGGEVIQAKE